MGELSKYDANWYRDNYVAALTNVKNCIYNNFLNMDFENADKRRQMEILVDKAVRQCELKINEWNNMSFR